MSSKSLTVTINSEPALVNAGANLAEVLAQWAGTDQQRLYACAINGEFVPRGAYQTTPLCNGDHIDIVQPIGGG